MKRDRPLLAAALAACLALGAGCGDGGEKKVASQVAVKVNSDEITVHQVNGVLARARRIAAEDPALVKREAIERLIQQELARQQAIVKKLDRSPQVVQEIEAARAEILARAYLQQVAGGQAKPTPEEVKKYYADHGELFAGRRVYAWEEISVAPGAQVGESLRRRVAAARSLQEIADWLKSQEVPASVSRASRAAEDIPLQVLPTLKGMSNGELRVVEVDGHIHVVRLVASKPAPVDEAAAAPRIEQFLANQRARQAMAEEVKRLRAQARIEYVGEFARPAANGNPALAAQPQAGQDEAAAKSFERAVRALR
jgi:EpsD family peptidyl-prolyl cis-trans isomerase